ncbi:hypothetical protein K435DRAFT_866989 [Dendrothele bispora CBS 962.96]|uniref:Uncharacterized protein n=1 Tax=Dendrothele bispora (strain CBS 962.96) TaxID=1314807 RepID=A0A4S8LFV6_DENBC|nr:hypothetical protein K435DRAFT_866989 [Dendrothele bispora CBS 962.96]
MSDNAIIFYDTIPSKSDILWSPNTWKVRYILNYKRIPYQTVMLEYLPRYRADNEGIASTNTKPDGSPLYTLYDLGPYYAKRNK